MFPLYDESAPRTGPPYLTIALIALNVLIFLASVFSYNFEAVVYNFGLIPERVLMGAGLFTFLSAMFLHADIFHLIGNMWFLWLFGDNLEHNLGALRFLFFYIMAGIIASLVHIFTVAPAEALLPIIGASGAISGVLGGYVVLFPKNKIRAFMMFYFRPYFFSVPAWFYAAVWFFYQLLFIAAPGSIAYMAHIGGFLGGMVWALPFKRKIKRKVAP